MTSSIDTIKAKVDVVDEIGLVAALQKSGKAFKGLCPFHNERTPSFYIFPESQTWRCFGCNEGGDVFTFVQKQQNLDFREALLYLAEKAGVALEDYSNRSPGMRSRVIGFGGRAVGDGQPKYLNTPQTLLFEKNSVLYALDMARDAIKQAKQVIIVEGYVDAVIAHQYGTKQTVACIGSAITEKHIQQIKKLTKQVTLALDPDEAGMAATEHGIQEALKAFDRTIVPVPMTANRRSMRSPVYKREPRGMIRLEERVDAEINVLQLPMGEDPDEVIRRDFSAWSYAVAHPLPLVDYYFVAKTSDLNLREAADKSDAAKRLLPVIGSISDRVKRDAYLRKLATMISIDERSLNEELQRILRGHKSNSDVAVCSDHSGQYRC